MRSGEGANVRPSSRLELPAGTGRTCELASLVNGDQMWIPETAAELESLISQGALEETATLDFKREISKSKDLARDVAAMANDGGVLVFGVGEDANGRPNILAPFALEGQVEKISAIVNSCLSEGLKIEIRSLRREKGLESGYLVVIVPPSPLAPHMVIVGGENRYYGRTAKGNVILTEGEVARLYERRSFWKTDREALLSEAVSSAPFEASTNFGHLHVFARPAIGKDELIKNAAAGMGEEALILEAIGAASQSEIFPNILASGFFRNTNHPQPTSAGWIVPMGGRPGGAREPRDTIDLAVAFDGSAKLFWGRAAERSEGVLRLLDVPSSELIVRLLYLAGFIAQRAGYMGPFDLGVAFTGIRGAISYGLATKPHSLVEPRPFDCEDYRQTTRVMASELRVPKDVARVLLSRLFHATVQGHIDPLEPQATYR